MVSPISSGVVRAEVGYLTQVNRPGAERHTVAAMSALQRLCWLTAAAALTLAWPASAQQSKTVSGLVVNFGIMSAEQALRADGHRDAHPLHPPSGSQHLLITVDDEKSGKRIDDAEVVIEITDPRGRVETKPLLHTQGGGLPDYSELFVFPWSGDYSIRVLITPKGGAKPVEARFTVSHKV
jgi:hypothetical protein